MNFPPSSDDRAKLAASVVRAGIASAAELENLGPLPGFPSRRDTIWRKAEDEGYEGVFQIPPGGGKPTKYYWLRSLPEHVRDAIFQLFSSGNAAANLGQSLAEEASTIQETAEDLAAMRRMESLTGLLSLTEEQQARVHAKVTILTAFKAFCQCNEGTTRPLFGRFNALYVQHSLGLQPYVYEALGDRLSLSTYYTWKQVWDEGNLLHLAGRYGKESKRVYRSCIDENPAMRDLIVGMIWNGTTSQQNNVNAKAVWGAVVARFGPDNAPSVRTVQRFISDFSKNYKVGLASPAEAKNKYQPAFGKRDEEDGRRFDPNEIWEVDSTRGDVLLMHREKDGSITYKRYAFVSVVDVGTRRAMMMVSPTSSSMAIALLLRRALMEWGIPKYLRRDNGKDYTSKQVDTILSCLGIDGEKYLCTPFTPEEKPYVERLFRTLQSGIFTWLQSYVGHDVKERQSIRDKARVKATEEARGQDADRVHIGQFALTPEEFQEDFLERWLAWYNNSRPHEGIGGRTPAQMLSASDVVIRTIPSEDVVNAFLIPVSDVGRGPGVRHIQKGRIRIDGYHYGHYELGAYPDEDVQCFYDPMKAGRICVYRLMTRAFICWAECPELSGANRMEIALGMRAAYNERRKSERRMGREAARRANVENIALEVALYRAQEADKIRSLPKASEAHTTPELDAAQAAIQARAELDAPQPMPAEMDPATKAQLHQLREAERRKDEIRRKPDYDSDHDLYMFLRKATAAGAWHEILPTDWDFLDDYERYLSTFGAKPLPRPPHLQKKSGETAVNAEASPTENAPTEAPAPDVQ